jgi:membrane protease YdiL (CAAX protease family)
VSCLTLAGPPQSVLATPWELGGSVVHHVQKRNTAKQNRISNMEWTVSMNTLMKSNQSAFASKSLPQAMREHALFSFFFLAYAFSWILFIPWVASEWSVLPQAAHSTLLHAAGTFGPTLAAYIMFRVAEAKEGWLRLRSRFRQFRVGWQWYMFILLGVPAMMLLGMLVLPGAPASFQGLPDNFLLRYPILFIAVFFGGGPLGEEIGWRGFALPRMQSRYGSLKGTLLLGVLWTFWHLPLFFSSDQGGGPGTGLSAFYIHLPIFLLMVVALAVIFTWVFNHTGGSVFIAVLLHASFDTFAYAVQPLFSASIVSGTNLPLALAMAVIAILILILTRGRLGYQPKQEHASSQGEME